MPLINGFSGDGGGSYPTWIISPTIPTGKVKAGDIWIQGNPKEIKVNTVIHVQTAFTDFDKVLANLDDPVVPNALYVLIPSENTVDTMEMIDFFQDRKYLMRAQCSYIVLTDANGAEIEITKGIYTGSKWCMFESYPMPTAWKFREAIAADTIWTPPIKRAWYRIHVFGKCGDGGVAYPENRGAASGSSGGNSGGYACSILQIDETVNCTVNATVTSFGNYLSATSGADGVQGNTSGYAQTAPSETVGTATGGNQYNLSGYKGGYGGRKYTFGSGGGSPGSDGNGGAGENSGAKGGGTSYPGGSKNSGFGGGGGGGARLPSPYAGFPYVPDTLDAYTAGKGGSYRNGGSSSADCSSGTPGNPYPDLDLKAPVLYGGGCGGGGSASDISNYGKGGVATAGSPGLIIIEEGAN